MFQHGESLLNSLNALESAVKRAMSAVNADEAKLNPMAERCNCYLQVVQKQKLLAQMLIQYSAEKNWEQVHRYAELIRGSSSLIQLEARSMIQELMGMKSDNESFQA